MTKPKVTPGDSTGSGTCDCCGRKEPDDCRCSWACDDMDGCTADVTHEQDSEGYRSAFER